MKTNLLLISEETLLERIKQIKDLQQIAFKESEYTLVDSLGGKLQILEELLSETSSLSKPLVMPDVKTTDKYSERVRHNALTYTFNECQDENELAFTAGANHVIDKINSQL